MLMDTSGVNHLEKYNRRGWDSNPRGETPMDQQSIALTTRPPRLVGLHQTRTELLQINRPQGNWRGKHNAELKYFEY